MQKPVYKNENILFTIALLLSLLFWAAIIFYTKGMALILLPIFFLTYLFVQSGFISYLKGTGALVSDKQFPDIQAKVRSCADKVGLRKLPDVYILHGNGVFNAFATRFLRKDYIILLSDVLDALEDDPEAIDFYIGHEMGHIDRKHLLYEPVLSLGLVLPLLGAAYSRAREYTCDLYGAACCTPEAAQKGIALLAVGTKRYKTINISEYTEQVRATSGFWMSFHELIASYPWLIKRFASVAPAAAKRDLPMRNPLAYIFAIFVPRLSITSAAVIYILVILMAGVLKGREFVKNAENAAAGDLSALEQPLEGDVPVYTDIEDYIAELVEDVNASVPMEIDSITMLERVEAEGRDTLVYNYTVSVPAAQMDLKKLTEAVYNDASAQWCDGDMVRPFRDLKGKVVYRYADNTGAHIGDIAIDTADCAQY